MPPGKGSNSRPLPKFGEWDVNNPESAEGFTVIFNKARDQKKSSGSAVNRAPDQNQNQNHRNNNYASNPPKKDKKPNKSKSWVCCFYGSCKSEAQYQR